MSDSSADESQSHSKSQRTSRSRRQTKDYSKLAGRDGEGDGDDSDSPNSPLDDSDADGDYVPEEDVGDSEDEADVSAEDFLTNPEIPEKTRILMLQLMTARDNRMKKKKKKQLQPKRSEESVGSNTSKASHKAHKKAPAPPVEDTHKKKRKEPVNGSEPKSGKPEASKRRKLQELSDDSDEVEILEADTLHNPSLLPDVSTKKPPQSKPKSYSKLSTKYKGTPKPSTSTDTSTSTASSNPKVKPTTSQQEPTVKKKKKPADKLKNIKPVDMSTPQKKTVKKAQIAESTPPAYKGCTTPTSTSVVSTPDKDSMYSSQPIKRKKAAWLPPDQIPPKVVTDSQGKTKKCKYGNWQPEEMETMYRIANHFKTDINGDQDDNMTKKESDKKCQMAFEIIFEHVNAVGGNNRLLSHLVGKFRDHKSNVKKKVKALLDQYGRSGAGGGHYDDLALHEKMCLAFHGEAFAGVVPGAEVWKCEPDSDGELNTSAATYQKMLEGEKKQQAATKKYKEDRAQQKVIQKTLYGIKPSDYKFDVNVKDVSVEIVEPEEDLEKTTDGTEQNKSEEAAESRETSGGAEAAEDAEQSADDGNQHKKSPKPVKARKEVIRRSPRLAEKEVRRAEAKVSITQLLAELDVDKKEGRRRRLSYGGDEDHHSPTLSDYEDAGPVVINSSPGDETVEGTQGATSTGEAMEISGDQHEEQPQNKENAKVEKTNSSEKDVGVINGKDVDRSAYIKSVFGATPEEVVGGDNKAESQKSKGVGRDKLKCSSRTVAEEELKDKDKVEKSTKSEGFGGARPKILKNSSSSAKGKDEFKHSKNNTEEKESVTDDKGRGRGMPPRRFYSTSSRLQVEKEEKEKRESTVEPPENTREDTVFPEVTYGKVDMIPVKKAIDSLQRQVSETIYTGMMSMQGNFTTVNVQSDALNKRVGGVEDTLHTIMNRIRDMKLEINDGIAELSRNMNKLRISQESVQKAESAELGHIKTFKFSLGVETNVPSMQSLGTQTYERDFIMKSVDAFIESDKQEEKEKKHSEVPDSFTKQNVQSDRAEETEKKRPTTTDSNIETEDKRYSELKLPKPVHAEHTGKSKREKEIPASTENEEDNRDSQLDIPNEDSFNVEHTATSDKARPTSTEKEEDSRGSELDICKEDSQNAQNPFTATSEMEDTDIYTRGKGCKKPPLLPWAGSTEIEKAKPTSTDKEEEDTDFYTSTELKYDPNPPVVRHEPTGPLNVSSRDVFIYNKPTKTSQAEAEVPLVPPVRHEPTGPLDVSSRDVYIYNKPTKTSQAEAEVPLVPTDFIKQEQMPEGNTKHSQNVPSQATETQGAFTTREQKIMQLLQKANNTEEYDSEKTQLEATPSASRRLSDRESKILNIIREATRKEQEEDRVIYERQLEETSEQEIFADLEGVTRIQEVVQQHRLHLPISRQTTPLSWPTEEVYDTAIAGFYAEERVRTDTFESVEEGQMSDAELKVEVKTEKPQAPDSEDQNISARPSTEMKHKEVDTCEVADEGDTQEESQSLLQVRGGKGGKSVAGEKKMYTQKESQSLLQVRGGKGGKSVEGEKEIKKGSDDARRSSRLRKRKEKFSA